MCHPKGVATAVAARRRSTCTRLGSQLDRLLLMLLSLLPLRRAVVVLQVALECVLWNASEMVEPKYKGRP